MKSNCAILTFYHKTLNENKIEEWEKYYFYDVWEYGQTGATVNDGYTNNNKIEILIPINQVKDKTLFTIGDIVCIGKADDIQKQSDLKGREFYNVTSIAVNDYGNHPHVHLGGQ